MSKTGVGGTGDQAVDPNEQTATRTRSPFESADDSWDLDEPVATKVASIPPPPVEESKVVDSRGTESKSAPAKSVNPSKFPSAMAELSKSDPALRTAAVAVPSQVSVSKTSAAKISAAKTSAAKISAAKTNAAKTNVSDNVVAPTVTPAPAKDESVAIAAVIEIGSGAPKSESKLESTLEVVKAAVTDFPSGSSKAPRSPQESLLSLDSEYVVEFFSSQPPAVASHVVFEFEPEIESIQPSRSIYPAEQLAQRRRHFRKVVVQVMFIALALFGLSLYVLWRRGMFALMGI